MANNIYFNSRAKALEAKLLTLDQLTSLANCNSVFEASRLLNEFLMLKGFEAKTFLDFLDVVRREENDFLKFLKTTTPNKDITKFFLLKYDYFNLECLFLQKKLAQKFELLPEGQIFISTMEKALQNDDTKKLLPPTMQNVLNYCNNLFLTGKQTGFLVDTAFKKAMYADMLEASKCDKVLFKLFSSTIDLKNIELCLRFKDKKLFDETKLLGGTIKQDFFEMLCEKQNDVILAKSKQSPYFVAVKLILEAQSQGKPFSEFEFLVDCFGITFFDDFKFRIDKNYAYIRYCLLKQNEIANLKIIFEGLYAKRSHKKICDSLRRVYAK